jgi:hypothetical protein
MYLAMHDFGTDNVLDLEKYSCNTINEQKSLH